MSASFGTCSRLIKVLAFDRKCESRSQKFAQKRFCGAEGIENVDTASDFATGDFGSQCRDAGFEFRHGKGVNILFDEIGQRVVAAERQIIIDIHAAYFTQQQLLSI